MMLSSALAWLREPSDSFTLSRLLRKGWPGLANFLLLQKPLELGRAARLVERTIFMGGMACFVYFGGLPIGSLRHKAGLTDALELAFMVKAIALIAGEGVQWSLGIVKYVVGGFERFAGHDPDAPAPAAQGRPINFRRYGGRKN
jgi:hypothetical protein